MTPEEIRSGIAELPQGEPTKCEGLIRNIKDQISVLENDREQEKLTNKLKTVACLGLHEDLKKMMERKGLRREGLQLVVNYLTNVPELAEYLYVNSNEEVEEAGLEMVKKRLGPDLEVLGGLRAAGIDVEKEWVKRLCKKAPSLLALPRLRLSELENCCQGADEGELTEVHRLVEFAESSRKQLSAIPQDKKLVQENKAMKTVDEEKLKKAKELMNEAKTMAIAQSDSAKKTVNENFAAIMSYLELPSDWFKQDDVKPEQLFRQLDEIIQQCSSVVETGETYKSNVEVITKASAGRALCGIYHSDYEAPKPAGRPLLQVPTDVTLTSPNRGQEINYMKFSKQGAAADYVRTVEESSVNIGVGVAGFYGLFVGEVQGGYGSECQTKTDHTVKTSTTNASVLQYIRTDKKTFRLERDRMRLSFAARKMARSIVQDKEGSAAEQEKSARLFLERYGSHFPAGVQTLGGVFFSIADAETKSSTETFKLTEAAVNHLKAQIAIGFLGGAGGIGGCVTGEYTSGEGKSGGSHSQSDTESFTYSVKSMGPQATNPATFRKLLSYNSTWALIDRGNFQGYIPVWELLRDLGSDYEAAAEVLEKTWSIDENNRKFRLENAEIERKTQNDVVELREQLKSMSVDMRMFSLTMRSLYVEKAVGTSTEAARKFTKLRDDTRNDAMVYLKGVLPLSTTFVASISEFFEYYEALNYNEWCEMLSELLLETVNYRQLCETLVKVHENILVPLKKRKDEAVVIVRELTDLEEEFVKKKKELEEKAGSQRSWAIALAFVPIVGLIASPILFTASSSNLAEAVAKGAQAKVQGAAAITVSEALIPALEAFIGGMKKAAGFFSVMEQELRKFEGKAEKGQSDPKLLYYKVMNKEAKDMKSICQLFYAVLPDVRTDFLAIPSEGTDQNYIDKWLEKQKKAIEETCTTRKLINKLRGAITGGEGKKGRKRKMEPSELSDS